MNNTELVQSYRQQISNVVNQANLQLFWNMYNRCGRPHPPREGAGQAAPSLACREHLGEGSFLPKVWLPQCREGAGPWTLVIGTHCWVERMPAAPLIPAAGLGAQPCTVRGQRGLRVPTSALWSPLDTLWKGIPPHCTFAFANFE